MINEQDKNKKKNENIHKDHRMRMRKRFESTRFDGWSKHEVLEFMLFYVFAQKDTNALAHMLLNNNNNSFTKLFENAQSECLKDIDGVGDSTLVFLRALKAFIGYYHSEAIKENPVQLTKENFSQILKEFDFSNETEDILMICLDNYMRIKYMTRLTEYSGSGYAMTKTERIAQVASTASARYVVLAHNHPSGCTKPSMEDLIMTQEAERRLNAMGIYLVDHYIVCKDQISSIKMLVKRAEKASYKPYDNPELN